MELYSILFEDADILIANKLAPVPVQPDKTGDKSLQDYLREELGAVNYIWKKNNYMLKNCNGPCGICFRWKNAR